VSSIFAAPCAVRRLKARFGLTVRFHPEQAHSSAGGGREHERRHPAPVKIDMPRDGSLTLSDIQEPTLTVVCERCGRYGRYRVDKLMAEHGDAKLTHLLVTLAHCKKARSFGIHEGCKAKFKGFSFRA
jgi:hypothetical protein